MAAINELRENRARLLSEMRKLSDGLKSADPPRDFTAEEKARWDEINDGYDQAVRHIEIAERVEKAVADSERAAAFAKDELRGQPDMDSGGEPNTNLVLHAWFRCQTGNPLSPEMREACADAGFDPTVRDLDIPLTTAATFRERAEFVRDVHPSLRADRLRMFRAPQTRVGLSHITGGSGGYFINDAFIARLENALLTYGPMLQVAEVIRTDQGNDISWPTSNDTSNTGALLGENTTIGASVDPTIGQFKLGAYKFSSKLITVPVELIEDAAFDLSGTLAAMLGERLGRVGNTYFTTGNASSQPQGIVNGSTVGPTTASATAIAADEIIDLEHSVDPAYRVGASFMAHDSIFKAIRKLKDGNGQYLWQPGLQAGVADRLLGYPILTNQDMSSAITANLKTMLFGQMNSYKVRQVSSIRLRRLVERYADYDQEGFIAFLRQDGGLLDAGTHPVKHLLQHA